MSFFRSFGVSSSYFLSLFSHCPSLANVSCCTNCRCLFQSCHSIIYKSVFLYFLSHLMPAINSPPISLSFPIIFSYLAWHSKFYTYVFVFILYSFSLFFCFCHFELYILHSSFATSSVQKVYTVVHYSFLALVAGLQISHFSASFDL